MALVPQSEEFILNPSSRGFEPIVEKSTLEDLKSNDQIENNSIHSHVHFPADETLATVAAISVENAGDAGDDVSLTSSKGNASHRSDNNEWGILRALKDKLQQLELYESMVLGAPEALGRVQYRVRGFIEQLNDLLEKDVALDFPPRELIPFSRNSSLFSTSSSSKKGPSALGKMVTKMIKDSKMCDAATQTAADRILQRVMQLEPVSAEELKLETMKAKELADLKRRMKEEEEEKKKRAAEELEEAADADHDAQEAEEELKKLPSFELTRALFKPQEERPGLMAALPDGQTIQPLFKPFLVHSMDKRGETMKQYAYYIDDEKDMSARAVARRMFEKRWRRGRVFRHYNGPLMRRVPPFIRYIRRHEETLAQRVGQLSVMLREAKALHDRMDRALELVDMAGVGMNEFDDSDDDSNDDELILDFDHDNNGDLAEASAISATYPTGGQSIFEEGSLLRTNSVGSLASPVNEAGNTMVRYQYERHCALLQHTLYHNKYHS